MPIGSLAALGVGSVSALVSYFTGDRAVLAATARRPIEESTRRATEADRLKLRQLDNVVDEMAIAAGLPRPAVTSCPTPIRTRSRRAAAPGTRRSRSPQGLLDALDREELQGVVAHEMSHIRNSTSA